MAGISFPPISFPIATSALSVVNGVNSFIITPGADGLATFGGVVASARTGTALAFSAAGGLSLTANGIATLTQWIDGAGRGRFIPQSDGVWMITNNASSDWGRLQFGGTTSSFPALARSGTILQARLADNSAYAPLEALNLAVIGAVSCGAASGFIWTGRTVILAPSDGVTKTTLNAGGQPTVATLPSAATVGANSKSYVTDALTPVFGSAVVGGGAVGVPVFSNGSSWIVG
jgi:hypothetical protein